VVECNQHLLAAQTTTPEQNTTVSITTTCFSLQIYYISQNDICKLNVNKHINAFYEPYKSFQRIISF
jgi:TRAP-type uncharacterized transport system substrate-binding protein